MKRAQSLPKDRLNQYMGRHVGGAQLERLERPHLEPGGFDRGEDGNHGHGNSGGFDSDNPGRGHGNDGTRGGGRGSNKKN